MKDELLFCPLGGSGEIGMNMNLFAYGKPGEHKWIMVDIGVTFADDTLPGIDLISSLVLEPYVTTIGYIKSFMDKLFSATSFLEKSDIRFLRNLVLGKLLTENPLFMVCFILTT